MRERHGAERKKRKEREWRYAKNRRRRREREGATGRGNFKKNEDRVVKKLLKIRCFHIFANGSNYSLIH